MPSSTRGRARLRPSAGTIVTVQAPAKAPSSAPAMPAAEVRQAICTRRANCTADQAVPQMAPPLLVPNSVAGAAVG